MITIMRNILVIPGWRKACTMSSKSAQEHALAESARHHTSTAMGKELLAREGPQDKPQK